MADVNTFTLEGSSSSLTNSPSPAFTLAGDGNHSSYAITVDGKPIGTFTSDVYGSVRIQTPPLGEGQHTIGGTENAPNPANPVVPLLFTIDLTPPPPCSVPTLASYSDTGTPGDNTTSYKNPAFQGTGPPNMSMLLFDLDLYGLSMPVGGAGIDSTGHWTSRTVALNPGKHRFVAVSQDAATNKSAPSPELLVTIVSDTTTPPSLPSAPTQFTAVRNVNLSWRAPTSDGGSAVTRYRVYRGATAETLAAEVSPTTLAYTASNAQANERFAVSVVTAQGEGPKTASI